MKLLLLLILTFDPLVLLATCWSESELPADPVSASMLLCGSASDPINQNLFCVRRRADPRQLPVRPDPGPGPEEEPPGGERGAVPAAGLRGPPPDRHHHPAPPPRASPEVPALLPASVPAAAAAQLRHLRHPPGEWNPERAEPGRTGQNRVPSALLLPLLAAPCMTEENLVISLFFHQFFSFNEKN